MSKIARITNDKKIFLGEEIIEYPQELEGGRNLLPDSHEEKSKTLGDSQAEHLYYADIYDILDKHLGRKLTISFDVEARVGHYLQAYCSNRSDDRTFEPHTFRDFGTEKQRLSFTTTSIEGGRGIHNKQAFLEFYGQYETGNVFKISNVKIELGDKATPWTPAPEDLGLTYPDFITRFGTYFKNNALATQEIIEYPPELEGGRNLLRNLSLMERTLNGVSLAYNNGKITLNGTCTVSVNFSTSFSIDGGIYTLSANNPEIAPNAGTRIDVYSVETGIIANPMSMVNDFRRGNLNSGTGAFRIRIEAGTTYTNFELTPKLELGSTSTKWTPAPEDLGLIYSDNIQSFGLKLSQGNELMARELIEYPKELLNSGRNLALDSYWDESNSKYLFKEFQTSEPLLVGNVYTLRIYGQLAEEKTRFGLYTHIGYNHFKNPDGTNGGGNLVNLGNDIYEATFIHHVIDGYEPSRHDLFRIYTIISTEVGESYIEKIKLEKGTQATPWTPAPEDLGYNI